MMGARIESADDFLRFAGLATQDVPLPDGRSVRVQELSVLQRAEFARLVAEDRTQAGAWLVAQACVNSLGGRVFTDEQVGSLMASSPRFVEHVAEAVMRFSGLLKDGQGNA